MCRLAAVVLALVAGCSSDDGGTPEVDLTQLGAACGPAMECSTGLRCLTYSGFGGMELHSCEIACDEAPAACPTGSSCVTISDGPGAVCRAR